MMEKETRERLAAAGFWIGDAEDFLGLTEDERRLVELRLAASRAVRRRREELGVTQHELARKLKSSQSRIAKGSGRRRLARPPDPRAVRGWRGIGGPYPDDAPWKEEQDRCGG